MTKKLEYSVRLNRKFQITGPCVDLWKRRQFFGYQSEEERRDAHSLQKLRKNLSVIREKKDAEMAFLLMSDFFQGYPLSTLGPRTVRQMAMLISGRDLFEENFLFIRDMFEKGLVHLSEAERLCEMLSKTDFSDMPTGQRRTQTLQLSLRIWRDNLSEVKEFYGVLTAA